MNHRLSELGKLRIVRDDGTEVGRLMDVRIRAKPGPVERTESMPVDALLIGSTGWLERIGVQRSSGLEIPPTAIDAVENDRIVMRTATKGGRKPRSRTKRR